jgi:hypothetical protein
MEAAPAWADPANRPPPAAPTAEQHEQELFSKYSTLNEPVCETIMRDVRGIVEKLKVVMMPMDYSHTLLRTASYAIISTSTAAPEEEQQQELEPVLSDNDKFVLRSLKDWDLWGPLVLCLSLAVILSFKAPTNQASLVFAAVFTSVWVGGTVVTVNAQLLGGTISFFQSLCVLGYSIFPLTLSAGVIGILKIFVRTWLWLDLIVVAVGCVWAMRASSVFISLYIKPERRMLALYPVVFFYVFLAWLILLF